MINNILNEIVMSTTINVISMIAPTWKIFALFQYLLVIDLVVFDGREDFMMLPWQLLLCFCVCSVWATVGDCR